MQVFEQQEERRGGLQPGGHALGGDGRAHWRLSRHLPTQRRQTGRRLPSELLTTDFTRKLVGQVRFAGTRRADKQQGRTVPPQLQGAAQRTEQFRARERHVKV
ncbi:hypothetical protein GCM10022631_38440 [Deinococcus rubellus]